VGWTKAFATVASWPIRQNGTGPMVIKRELAKVGECVLVQTQFIGVSGQVCSVVYELTGPCPQHFTDYALAERALRMSAPSAVWSEPLSWEAGA